MYKYNIRKSQPSYIHQPFFILVVGTSRMVNGMMRKRTPPTLRNGTLNPPTCIEA